MFDAQEPELAFAEPTEGVVVAVPHLPPGCAGDTAERMQRKMIDQIVGDLPTPDPILWFYTPMSFAFTNHVRARAVVYDCMDELSMFHGAPPELTFRERLLLQRADVVFTGGHSLYEYKRKQHHNIHPFPSSVDAPHFAKAREVLPDPPDQAEIPHPRVGFFGVVDERMDIALIDELASTRSDLQIVMIGPVVKIDPARLPRRPNIHWLGSKRYEELPGYLAGWDVAMLPFARNDSTRFISPTKTPEYLAAGMPVVSTSIEDVVRPYGDQGLAWIADTAADFAHAIDESLASDRAARLANGDAFLADLSWDRTWREMWAHVERVVLVNGVGTSARVSGAATAGGTARALAESEE